jgi:hypothetical protein
MMLPINKGVVVDPLPVVLSAQITFHTFKFRQRA